MKLWSNPSGKLFDIANYVFLAIYSICCFYPFYYILIYSLSDSATAERSSIVFWPKNFTFDIYVQLFAENAIAHAAFISVSRTVLGIVVSVFFTAYFAFLISQEKLRFRKLVYRLCVATMFLSPGLIPNYLLLKNLGLQNNFLVYIIPGAISAFNVILVKTFIEQLPYDLQESAKMDGANFFTIFTRIIFPITTPVLAVIAIFTGIGQWSSWFDNFILADTDKLRTLAYTLYLYLKDNAASYFAATADPRGDNSPDVVKLTPKSLRMAVTMVVTLPVLFVYPMFQRFFVKGIMLGSMKG